MSVRFSFCCFSFFSCFLSDSCYYCCFLFCLYVFFRCFFSKKMFMQTHVPTVFLHFSLSFHVLPFFMFDRFFFISSFSTMFFLHFSLSFSFFSILSSLSHLFFFSLFDVTPCKVPFSPPCQLKKLIFHQQKVNKQASLLAFVFPPFFALPSFHVLPFFHLELSFFFHFVIFLPPFFLFPF